MKKNPQNDFNEKEKEKEKGGVESGSESGIDSSVNSSSATSPVRNIDREKEKYKEEKEKEGKEGKEGKKTRSGWSFPLRGSSRKNGKGNDNNAEKVAEESGISNLPFSSSLDFLNLGFQELIKCRQVNNINSRISARSGSYCFISLSSLQKLILF